MPQPPQERLARYADLVLRLGLDFRPGRRLLVLDADVTAAPFFARLAEQAHELGARRVDVVWRDEAEIRARVARAPLDSLAETPPHVRAALDATTDEDAVLRCASFDPRLFADLDPGRVALYQRGMAEGRAAFMGRVRTFAFPWTAAGVPTPAWARAVFPALTADAALDALWEAVRHAVRLDLPDPVAAWRAHVAALQARRDVLQDRHFAALHFRGPGTDLTVGLADGHRWMCVGDVRPDGSRPVVNLPSEEVFTAPHRDRVDGVVSATRPLNLGGVRVEGLRVRFENGRAVEARADAGEEVVRRLLAGDEGAARLGEVALVPHSSPLSRTGLLFHNVLLDENAASHLAFGLAIGPTVHPDPARFDAAGGNRSAVHVDWMIGSGEVDVDGVAHDGRREAVMRAGEWVPGA